MEKELTGYPSIDRPWMKQYADEAVFGQIPETNIWEFLYTNNSDYPKQEAMEYLGSKISYGLLFENTIECAKALCSLGCRKGDIITIAMPSMPEAIYSIYACNYLGLIANIIHPLASQNEIINYLNEVKSTVFIMFEGTYDLVWDQLDKTCVKTAVVVSAVESCLIPIKLIYNLKNRRTLKNGSMTWREFIRLGAGKGNLPSSCSLPDDVAVISHTGGTTGEPKGVVLTNRNLVSEIWQIGSTMVGGRGTRMLTVLPPFVNYSLTNCILEPLSLGIGIVLIPKYEPERLCEYIRKYRPGHINSIPPYWEVLLSDERSLKTDYSFLITHSMAVRRWQMKKSRQ